ncbi:hypothetical protein [Oceaniglobus roseus]|uniref:hypothetical protein n=1 Tax=Oceaniglobus roseus TaxID=1737570 RepID=UPI001FE81D56|nr:hypothetical protein [Kandeliimicrobium roseum]
MPRPMQYAAVLLALSLAGPLQAADYSDPEWPCLQRRVDSLSLGVMWPRPVPERDLDPALAAAAGDLVGRLELRRIPVEETPQLIADFVAAHPDLTGDDMSLVFADLFTRMNRDRSKLIKGITRYSLSQAKLAERIDETRVAMDAAMAKVGKTDADFDAIDKMEEQIAWDERIYQDRKQSLTYVCETPVLIEKRLFAIAREMDAAIPPE